MRCFWNFLPKIFVYFCIFLPKILLATYCYECTSAGRQDRTCNRYVGTSCGYGLFGCVKIATFSGGVNKMGNFIDDERNVVSMVRACNLLPIGGVDACSQQVVLGMRVVTCYCYSDYCNSGWNVKLSYQTLGICLLLFFGFLWNFS